MSRAPPKPEGRLALLAAGGTGGHLFPAQSLALELKARGWRIALATDHRVASYGKDFPADAIHIIPSATPSGGGALVRAMASASLGVGVASALMLLARPRPAVAIGFGGYPTVPPIFAATLLRVPSIVHEANAVLGRANRFLSSRVTRVALGQPGAKGSGGLGGKSVETGNPVRPAVIEAAKAPYPKRAGGDPFRLLVFGGSQGARIFSEVLPPALEKLAPALRTRIELAQQCRPEDLEKVKAAYEKLGLAAELQPFFFDMAERIAASHLIIARAGASTLADLGVIGRPSILVPLPGAIDQDQKTNAMGLVALGGGWMIEQTDFTPERLAKEISEAMNAPERLEAAGAAARRFGRPDAAKRLADLVEAVAAGAAVNAAETPLDHAGAKDAERAETSVR